MYDWVLVVFSVYGVFSTGDWNKSLLAISIDGGVYYGLACLVVPNSYRTNLVRYQNHPRKVAKIKERFIKAKYLVRHDNL